MKNKTGAPYQKNEIVTLTITGLGSSGEGIGRLGALSEESGEKGYTVFVKDAIIGDRVRASIMKAGRTYAYARLQEILEPSSDRITPRCPIARSCGGCQIQMMDYRAQLAYKKNKVREDLIRIGGFDPVLVDAVIHPAVGMDGPGEEPWRYRNKEQVPVGYDREGRIAFGFYAGRTHSIVPMKDCLIGREGNSLILERVREWMEKYHVEPYDEAAGKGTVRHILIRDGRHSGQIMVCIVANADSLPGENDLAAALSEIPGMTSISLNTNKEKTNVILGRKVRTLWGRDAIEDSLFVHKVSYPDTESGRAAGNEGPVFAKTQKSVCFGISPLSFYQVNPGQTEKLYSIVLDFAGLTGKEIIWDLYCGVGTISLFMARSAGKVYGVEIIPAAIEDAKRNAERNDISNAEFFVGKAEEVLPAYVEEQERKGGLGKVGLIVVDPPRKGCDSKCLETILKIGPEKVIYVSCDPATLARDLKILTRDSYCLKEVQPCDMFPHSSHVETIVLLQKLNS